MYDLRGRIATVPSRVEVLPTAFAGMGMALGLTGAVSWWASHNIPGIGQWLWPLIILQFGLILAIGTVRAWAQEADNLSLGLLFVYAGVTGLVLAPVSSLTWLPRLVKA